MFDAPTIPRWKRDPLAGLAPLLLLLLLSLAKAVAARELAGRVVSVDDGEALTLLT